MQPIPIDYKRSDNDLPETEVIPLRRATRSKNVIGTLHYSMDPNKDPNTPTGKKWKESEQARFQAAQHNDPTLGNWEQEYEISFSKFAGTPVYGNFSKALHTLNYPGVLKDRQMIIGFDFGGTNPAYFLSQVDSCGRWIWHHGVKLDRIHVREMCLKIQQSFNDDQSVFYHPKGWEIRVIGDHAGTYENNQGVPGKASEIVTEVMKRSMESTPFTKEMKKSALIGLNEMFGQLIEKAPAIIINPASEPLIKLCEGGYRYKEGREEVDDVTDTYYIHIADAIRYVYWILFRSKIKAQDIKSIDPGYPMEFI